MSTTNPTPSPQEPDDAVRLPKKDGQATPPAALKKSKQKKSQAAEKFTAKDWAVTLVFLLIIVAIPFIWMQGLGVLAVAETVLRVGAYAVLLIALPLLLALALWPDEARNRRAVRKGHKPRGSKKHASIAALVAVLGGGYAFAVHPYLVAKAYTAGTQTIEETTSYADRAPWVVANNYAQRDQGDIIGDRDDVHYVPAAQDAAAKAGDGTGEGTSRYTVLVKERGILKSGGYQAIQTLTMPTTGTIPADASTFCEVPDGMNKRLNSIWPWYSLNWSIHAKAPFAHWNKEDAYGYCAANQPVIVVPLYAYSGFWNVTKTPNGAAIYSQDGVQILSPEELTSKGIEGPTYPRSLATTQRESINAGGTITQWWGSKYGYDLTDEDSEDSNAENPSDFTLIDTSDHTMRYVTPLTPRGSSQSITALSVLPATQSSTERAPQIINTATDLPATSTLTTAIKESSVQGDNAWTTRWASGMRVYEILPARDGHWAASIGQGQAVSYRADIAPDGKVTVVNADTGQSSGASGGTADSVTVDGGKPLDQMTEAELLDLIQDATSELQKRQK